LSVLSFKIQVGGERELNTHDLGQPGGGGKKNPRHPKTRPPSGKKNWEQKNPPNHRVKQKLSTWGNPRFKNTGGTEKKNRICQEFLRAGGGIQSTPRGGVHARPGGGEPKIPGKKIRGQGGGFAFVNQWVKRRQGWAARDLCNSTPQSKFSTGQSPFGDGQETLTVKPGKRLGPPAEGEEGKRVSRAG